MIRLHASKGTTLAISLMLLFIITLIGVTSIRTTQIQEKMSHNVQDKIASFQAAETALLGAENLVGAIPTEVIPTSIASCPNVTVNGVAFCILNFNSTLLPEDMTTTWWNSNATDYAINYPGSTLVKNKVATIPRFYIEFTAFVSDSLVIGKAPPAGIHYYRIFSLGTGSTDTARTILESSYNKRY
jgi:type IV pilus assembly protein PilX